MTDAREPTPVRIREPSPERPGTPGIVFVTGASRSGTTMLARMLGRARDAYTLHELHYFGELVPFEHTSAVLPRERAERAVAMTLARHARDYWVSGPTPEERSLAREIVDSVGAARATGDRLFAATMDRIRDMAGAAVLCEQTPRNVYYAFHLLDAFPDCRIVHVVRDPRAVLASQKRRYQLRKLGGHNVPVREVVRLWLNYHPITMVRLWRSATREILRLEGYPRVSIVRYEDLVLDAEATVRGLCDEIGLPFEREMLNVPHWGSSTVRHTSAAGPSAAALDKWREILDGQEVAYCDAATVAERRRFAYPDAAPAVRLKDRVLFGARLPLHVVGTVLANPKRAAVQIKALFARASKSRDEKSVDDAAVH
ncbi:MAG TPA: sulfotransferase [Woeseiaceae bacterium]|nr:sulfotransferase [Woeseiaceae bacterium]